MFAEDFLVVDTDTSLWSAARPFVEAALRLDQGDGAVCWHGWDKQQCDRFLRQLPSPCSLLVAVWESEEPGDGQASWQDVRERLVLGCVCEVVAGEVRSLRTLASLQDQKLPSLEELEPGYQHAFELMRAVREVVAPVAWALFTDRQIWNEWIFAEKDDHSALDKGSLLAELAQQGKCVLMGSQTTHHS